MGRTPCCNADGLKKGAWTADEDQKLTAYINEHGEGGWRTLPQKAGLQRCGKSCRLRWINYLRPDIKRGEFSPEEEQTIIHLHASKGNKWSVIARHITGRTDNEIKNYWNTHIKRRLVKMGIDPVTHKPIGAVDSPRQKDSNTVANPDHTSEVPQLESQASPSQSRSVSASAQLLNKVATNLARTASHGTLSVVVESSSGSESNKGQSIESPKFSSSSSENSTSSISNSSSTSKILNRMASKLTLIKEILSTSIETVATDDCSDARGGGGGGDEDDSALYVFHGDIGNSFIAEWPLSASTPSLSESTMEISMSDSVSAGLMAATLSPSCCDHLDMTNESGIIGQDSTFDMDISCSYNMDSPISSINFLQDITAQDPPFKLGNLLDTSGGEVKNDFASRNMMLESQDASSDVEEPGFTEVLIDFLLNDPDDSENTLSTSTRDSHVNYVFESTEGKSLHESMNNWNDNLDFGNYGVPD